MAPDEFRRAAHEVVDLIADYLEHVEEFAGAPAVEPGSLRPLFPAGAARGPEPLDAILADVAGSDRAQRHPLAAPGVLRLLRDVPRRVPGILGELLTAALGSNAMLWRTSPVATELEEVVVDWLRQGLGLPDGIRRPDHRHGLDVHADRAGGGARGRRHRRGGVGLAGRADVPRAAGLRLDRGAFLHREGRMTLGLGRTSVASHPRGRGLPRWTSTRSRRRSRRTGRRPPADRDRRARSAPRPRPPSTRSRAIADVAEREGLWLHVDAAYAGAVALIPERRGPFAGWERADFDRREPAQVVVHAARRVAAADPPDARPRDGVQPRARVPAHARSRRARARLQRVHAAARPPVPGAEAVVAAALVRARRACAAHRAPYRSSRRSSRAWVARDPDCRAPRAGAVLDRLLPLPAAASRRRRRPTDAELDELNARTPRPRSTRSGRGLPLAHAASRPVHDPGRDRQPADRRAPRPPGVGPPAGAAARRRRRRALRDGSWIGAKIVV